MNQSENVDLLAAALAEAQQGFTPVPKTKTAVIKTKTGGNYDYKYADLADVLAMALPVLSRSGLYLGQGTETKPTGLWLVTRIIHKSGQWLSSDGIPLKGNGSSQDLGAEITYARRYDACALLGIAPDEDTDGVRGAEMPNKGAKQPYAANGATGTQARQGTGPAPSESAFCLTNDLLTCRPLSAKSLEKEGEKFIAVKLNGELNRSVMAFCFIESLFAVLLDVPGKKCVFRMDCADYPYIREIIQIEGKKFTPPVMDAPDPAPTEKSGHAASSPKEPKAQTAPGKKGKK